MNILKVLVFSILALFFGSSCSNKILGDKNDARGGGFVLTFDDSFVPEWYGIHNVLESYDAKATFFITRFYNLTSEEINLLRDLEKRGNEVGSHSYSHISALEYLKTHSAKEYIESEIIPSLRELRNHGFTVSSFAYPFGDNNDELDTEVMKYISMIRDLTEIQRTKRTIPVIDIDEIFYKCDGAHIIYGLDIDKNFDIPLNEIDESFKRARDNSEIIIFYAHKPVEKAENAYEIEISYLDSLLQKAQSYGLKSYTVSELLKIKK
jgi:peptidoglycan-N-acetylglucosamine deacetylase